MKNVLFIDRDGTLIEEPEDNQVDSLSKIRLCENVIAGLQTLIENNFELIMISNQDGLGTPDFPKEDFQNVQDFILRLFKSQGIEFKEIYICPHKPSDACLCRKPKIGLLEEYLKNNIINKTQSWVIGDRESDRFLAENLGVSYLAINKEQSWKEISEKILNQNRSASFYRKTNETEIDITVNLDSNQTNQIKTPIAFFTHMLEQIAKHGGFHLNLKANGDVAVDDHHLVEDTAIALGEALKIALGDKWGINRYNFTLPMDESLASVNIDICGRPYCIFKANFTREFVGDMSTEMVRHFFQSLSYSLGATIHVSVQGENHHHMIEACFKALGRALQEAMQKTRKGLPSTKGVL